MKWSGSNALVPMGATSTLQVFTKRTLNQDRGDMGDGLGIPMRRQVCDLPTIAPIFLRVLDPTVIDRKL
jgi:hypothetical protein